MTITITITEADGRGGSATAATHPLAFPLTWAASSGADTSFLHRSLSPLHVSALPPILHDPDTRRRHARLRELNVVQGCREFAKRRDGMIHAMDGGLWLHRHVWLGEPLVHLVSTDRARLVAYGAALGLSEARLQYKPLKDPRTDQRREAWHWDLGGPVYPPRDERLWSAPPHHLSPHRPHPATARSSAPAS